MANVDVERLYLTRKEAANYITKRYFNVSPLSLARYAVDKTGPAYFQRGRDALYTREDLDAWVVRSRHDQRMPPAPRQPRAGALTSVKA